MPKWRVKLVSPTEMSAKMAGSHQIKSKPVLSQPTQIVRQMAIVFNCRNEGMAPNRICGRYPVIANCLDLNIEVY